MSDNNQNNESQTTKKIKLTASEKAKQNFKQGGPELIRLIFFVLFICGFAYFGVSKIIGQ